MAAAIDFAVHQLYTCIEVDIYLVCDAATAIDFAAHHIYLRTICILMWIHCWCHVMHLRADMARLHQKWRSNGVHDATPRRLRRTVRQAKRQSDDSTDGGRDGESCGKRQN